MAKKPWEIKKEEEALRKRVATAVEQEFHARLPNCNIPESPIVWAVADVYETSGISETGEFADGDIALAVTRVLINAIEDKIERLRENDD